MPETIQTRVTRIENLIGRLAEKQERLDDVVVLLTEAQIKTEERFQEAAKRSKQTDARIEKLVSAIGEFIRNTRQ
jgi:hypothetical protein